MKAKFVSLFTARWARIAIPLIVFGLGIGLTACSVKMQKTSYTASSRLWIQPRVGMFVRDSDATTEPIDSPLTSGPNALRTACEILHSAAVTKFAEEELKKKFGDDAPDEGSIASGIKAQPIENTDILEIKYTCQDADQAVTILTAILDAFYHENNMQVTGPIQQSKEKLEKQLKMAQDQYSESKNKVKQFQDTTSSIDLMADVSSLNDEKSVLEKTIEECKHDLIGMKSQLDYAKRQLGFGPEDVVAVEKLSSDEIMTGLRQSIAETEVQLISLRAKFQDEHPKVKRLKAQLEEAKKEIEARYNLLIGRPELRESFIAAATDAAQQKLLEDMTEASTGIAAMGPKMASLSESLARVKSKLAAVPRQQMELENIRRGDELATNSLTAIERELQRVHLTETVATNNSNMQIIDEPQMVASSTPNTWLFGVAGSLFLSLLVAVGQFLLLPKYVSAARLPSLLPVRIAGFIPQLDRSNSSVASLMASADRLRQALIDWFNKETVPVLVTSGNKDDGKSTVIYSLAVCLADAGKKVLVIDADTHCPTIHRMAGISASPGLLQFLGDPTADHLEMMQAVRENLTVIPAGGISDNPRGIKHPRFVQLVNELSRHFDAVLIDAVEGGTSIDSLVAPVFDCRWLVVARVGHTLVGAAQNLATQLDFLPGIESAMVVNGVRQKDTQKLRLASPAVAAAAKADAGVVVASAMGSIDNETASW